MKYNFISIEGIIGSGKTSLATLLAEEHNAQLLLEEFADNPFLPSFYKEKERFAFPLEMSFLAERYHQQAKVVPTPNLFQKVTISDYIFAKCLIFAKTNLSGHELKLYQEFFNITTQRIRKPELILYLHLSPDNALDNIAKRGRDYEQSITPDYLNEIQSNYFEYFKQKNDVPILLIDTNEIDFVNCSQDYKKINALLNKEYEKGIHRIIP
jgi:deoxyadenosine/deoxycytidine kinase